MKHLFRFFGQVVLEKDGTCEWNLCSEDAFHLQKVLRLEGGCEVEVADGLGRWCSGQITEVTGRGVRVQSIAEHYEQPALSPLVLAVAAMKPASFEELLPSLVELGVDKIFVFTQSHTDRKWYSEKIHSRWQRIIVSAMKQCKRNWLPEVVIAKNLEQVLQTLGPSLINRYLLEPTAEQTLLAAPLQAGPCLMVVGSEKGLTEDEKQVLIRQNFLAIGLGNTILRAYTACLAATAVMSAKRDSVAKNLVPS